MKRRLSYAVRTLVGPWLLLPALGLEIAAFSNDGMPWRGEGMWTVEWFAIPLLILGPLCAAGAAVDASRLSRPGNVHLVLSVPRPAKVYLRAAGWCAAPVIGLHLLAITAGVVVGQVRQPSVGWWSMIAAALVQSAAILWFAAVGSAIGRLSSPLLAGLLSGGAGYVLIYVAGEALTSEPTFRLLNLGAATITMIGKAYNSGYLAGQAITFALTSLLLLLLPLRRRSGHNIPTLNGAAAFLLVVAVVTAGPAVFPDKRTVDVPQPPDLCYNTKPQVCLYYEHRRYAELVIPQVQALSRAALDAGYPALVPERVMENSRTFHASGPKVRPVWLPVETYEEGRLPLEAVAYFMVEPSHCPQLYPTPQSHEPPSMEYNERLFSVLATWLHLAGRELGHTPVPYRILSPLEVEQTLDDFARCELDGKS